MLDLIKEMDVFLKSSRGDVVGKYYEDSGLAAKFGVDFLLDDGYKSLAIKAKYFNNIFFRRKVINFKQTSPSFLFKHNGVRILYLDNSNRMTKLYNCYEEYGAVFGVCLINEFGEVLSADFFPHIEPIIRSTKINLIEDNRSGSNLKNFGSFGILGNKIYVRMEKQKFDLYKGVNANIEWSGINGYMEIPFSKIENKDEFLMVEDYMKNFLNFVLREDLHHMMCLYDWAYWLHENQEKILELSDLLEGDKITRIIKNSGDNIGNIDNILKMNTPSCQKFFKYGIREDALQLDSFFKKLLMELSVSKSEKNKTLNFKV